MVLDTNVVIYLLEGRVTRMPPDPRVGVSIVSEIELLSYDRLDASGDSEIRAFLETVEIVGLSGEIKEAAIALRRKHRVTIPDAIIAATSLVLGATLLTNDEKLAAVSGLNCQSVALREA